MAMRLAARYVPRRFSSSGKILSEEEKAAENIYIKKVEKEKLEKLARQGLKPEENPTATTGGSVTDAKPSASASSGSEKVSSDKSRNYAVVAGTVAALAALGWYLKGKPKKEEVHD